MIHCPDFQKRLDLFLDGEVDGRTMRELALHVSRCVDCEAELRRAETLQQLLADSVQAEVECVEPRELWGSISSKLSSARPSLAERVRGRWGLRSAAGSHPYPLSLAASLIALLLVAGALWSGRSNPPPMRAADNHAQIDRLDSNAPDVAVWSEPEERTTAIWVASFEP